MKMNDELHRISFSVSYLIVLLFTFVSDEIRLEQICTLVYAGHDWVEQIYQEVVDLFQELWRSSHMQNLSPFSWKAQN